MRDGRTRKLDIEERNASFDEFLMKWKAIVVILSGEAGGTEYEIAQPSVTLGRGEDADWSLSDDSISTEHAVLEFAQGGIRLRDLGSMNGMRLNGAEVKAADLKNGDRFQLGEQSFQFVLEKRPKQPRTYMVPED